MKKTNISRDKTGMFSNIANVLTTDQHKFDQFINAPYSKEALIKQKELKKGAFSSDQRELLSNVLRKQLKDIDNDKVLENVDLLTKENTFTVTTGHQLNIYSGPMYVVYKIMHIIKLSESLNAADPETNYVPLFWMATEDHDFEEINHLHLFNDTLKWDTDQEGPVGRFSLDDFHETKNELLEKFQNNESFSAFIQKHYSEGSLADATRKFIGELFEDYGLIILDADDRDLKESFSQVMEKEIITQFAEGEVQRYTEQLNSLGFDGQVTPRPINLFYITEGLRERIKYSDGNYQIGDRILSKEEILKELNDFPERFSPNVVLRPVYQEFILPNLCYVGGGGEMSYWLQLKGVFDELKLLFPIIQVRNSVQFIDGIALKKLNKLDLSIEQLFEGIHNVKKQFVLEHEENALDFSDLDEKKESLKELIESLVVATDKGLEGYGKSESTKLNKQIEGLKQKLIRHQKKKHEDAMNQIDNLFERLFPAGGLQERYDNVIPKLAKYGKSAFIKLLEENMDPFEERLIILIED